MVLDVKLNKVFKDTSKDDSTVRQTSACSLCKSESLVTDTESGEVICSKCGMVISEKTQETRSESRTFPNTTEVSKERARTGMPNSLASADMGLSTVIGMSNRDASGNKIEPSMLSTMHRLRTWDFRTQVHTSADRNFRLAFTELDTLKDKLGLPDSIIEKTAYICRKAQQRNLARGRSVSVILTAAVYIACREAGIPKTLKEITVANNTKHKLVAKAYRVLVSELGGILL
jgi:transcription initiation factor TFIIB